VVSLDQTIAKGGGSGIQTAFSLSSLVKCTKKGEYILIGDLDCRVLIWRTKLVGKAEMNFPRDLGLDEENRKA